LRSSAVYVSAAPQSAGQSTRNISAVLSNSTVRFPISLKLYDLCEFEMWKIYDHSYNVSAIVTNLLENQKIVI
jgi:hypothetical protein